MSRFTFERKDNTVKVTFNPTQKSVVVKTNDVVHGFSTDVGKFRYYEYSGLVQGIIDCIADGNYIDSIKTRIPEKANHKKIAWLRGELYKQLGKAFHDEWKYLHTYANVEDLELDKAITKCIGPKSYKEVKILSDEEFWQNPFIRKDCINFRAACLASIYRDKSIHDYEFNIQPWEYSQWKESYDREFTTYTSLNKTFPAINFRVPWYMMNQGFRQNRLPHPYKLREQVVSHYVSANRQGLYLDRTINTDILLDADKVEWDETKKAFKKMMNVDFRKINSLVQMCQYLLDYPERYQGTLIGLLRRGEEWHRRIITDRNKSKSKYSDDTPTAKLPVEMNIDGITFLKSVGEIIEEGQKMVHCVSSYSNAAVKGRSYLFHIDYKKQQATCEITSGFGGDYRINQIYGPRNQDNLACEWGKKTIGGWISKFLNKVK